MIDPKELKPGMYWTISSTDYPEKAEKEEMTLAIVHDADGNARAYHEEFGLIYESSSEPDFPIGSLVIHQCQWLGKPEPQRISNARPVSSKELHERFLLGSRLPTPSQDYTQMVEMLTTIIRQYGPDRNRSRVRISKMAAAACGIDPVADAGYQIVDLVLRHCGFVSEEFPKRKEADPNEEFNRSISNFWPDSVGNMPTFGHPYPFKSHEVREIPIGIHELEELAKKGIDSRDCKLKAVYDYEVGRAYFRLETPKGYAEASNVLEVFNLELNAYPDENGEYLS